MKLTITIELGGELIDKIVRGIMDNYPEAGAGCALQCTAYNYKDLQFNFRDVETGKFYMLGQESLYKAFPLLFSDKWPKGCTQPPRSCHWEHWDEWLCQADATDFDAFVQLACLGEVIYG